MQDWGIALIGVPIGFTIGTLGEYWIHRGMHKGGVLAGGHGEHHREGWGQGAFKEFRDYTLGTGIALLIGLPIDVFFLTGGRLAASGALGGLLHAFFAAWCHQAQHEDPRLLPWMAATPVHFVHHKRQQARHNFGISVDWWDRVFGTYKVDSDWRSLVRTDRPRRWPWQIHWFTPNIASALQGRHVIANKSGS